MDLITLNQPQYDQNIRAAQTAGFELFTTGVEATWYYPEMPALYEYEKYYRAIHVMLFQYWQVLEKGLTRMTVMKDALVQEEADLIGTWRQPWDTI